MGMIKRIQGTESDKTRLLQAGIYSWHQYMLWLFEYTFQSTQGRAELPAGF